MTHRHWEAPEHTIWRELISALTSSIQPIGDLEPGPDFFPGASPDQLNTVERILRLPLPEQLRALLAESNGVLVCFGQHFIWNSDELLQYNQPPWITPDYWRDGRSGQDTQHLLFFGDAGVDGIQFGFPITTDGAVIEHVFAWYPIGRRQVRKASSLKDYVEGWLSGTLTV